ncbi:MAG: choice-of-anchor D domain-containing protein, partial [Planctomycetes bacterium]|nr:choice-of-anchor D domain-containing protein [Planctomycetota bacterium]
TSYYGFTLQAEVVTDNDISVDLQWLDVDDTTMGQSSDPLSIEITNTGTELSKLTISQWFFGGNNFEVIDAKKVLGINGTVVPVNLSNTDDSNDDVTLEFGDILTLDFVFSPDLVEVFNDTFYIISDDTDEHITPVALTGLGESGSNIVVLDKNGVTIKDNSPILDNPLESIVDFGSVLMGQEFSIDLTIHNGGDTSLIIPDLGIFTSNPQIVDVTFVNPLPITLEPGEDQIVTVTFMPPPEPLLGLLDPIEMDETLRIFSNDPDPDKQDYLIQLVGLAVPARTKISVLNGDGVTDVLSLDFGTIPVDSSLTKTIEIQNIGGSDLIIRSFVFPSELGNPFSVTPENLSNFSADDILIPIGNTPVFVDITFAPNAAGLLSNQLLIISNDLSRSVWAIDLVGNAVPAADLQVTDSRNLPDDQDIDFGKVSLNQTSTPETITLTNIGSSPLTLTGWTLASPNGLFTLSPVFDGTEIVLQPAETYELTVTFTPLVAGNFETEVIITSSDSTNPTIKVDLKGENLPIGDVFVSPAAIDFTPTGNAIRIGYDTSETRSIAIINHGVENLTITGIVIKDPTGQNPLTATPFQLDIFHAQAQVNYDGLDPQNSADDIMLLPGQTQEILVRFEPKTLFDGSVMVVITTDDASVTGEVILSGESVNVIEIGKRNGTKNPAKLITDEDNRFVKIKLSGGGYGLVVLEGGSLGGGKIESIELFETTSKSKLTITSVKLARNVPLPSVGDIMGGALNSLTLKNVIMAGDIQLESVRGIKFTAAGVVDGQFNIDGELGKLIANKTTFKGSLQANKIGKVTFMNVEDAAISTRTTLKSLVVRQNLVDSLVLGGYDLGSDGRLGDDGTPGAADTLFGGGFINSVKIRGGVDDSFIAVGILPKSSNFFDPLETKSGRINRVRFGSLIEDGNQTPFGIPFGVAASSSIGDVKFTKPDLTGGSTSDRFKSEIVI